MIKLKLKDAIMFETYTPHVGFPTIAIKTKIKPEELYGALQGQWPELFAYLNASLNAKYHNVDKSTDPRYSKQTGVSPTTETGKVSKDFKAWMTELLNNDGKDIEIGFLVQILPKKNQNSKSVNSGLGAVTLDNSTLIACPLFPNFVRAFNSIMKKAPDGAQYVIADESLLDLTLSNKTSLLRNALFDRAYAAFGKRTQNKLDKIANLYTTDEYEDATEEKERLLKGFAVDGNLSYYDDPTNENEVQKAFNNFIEQLSNQIKGFETGMKNKKLLDNFTELMNKITDEIDAAKQDPKAPVKSIYDFEESITDPELKKAFTIGLDGFQRKVASTKSDIDKLVKSQLAPDKLVDQLINKELQLSNLRDQKGALAILQSFKEYLTSRRIIISSNGVESLMYQPLTYGQFPVSVSSNALYNKYIADELEQLINDNYLKTFYDFVLFISTNLTKLKQAFISAADRYVSKIQSQYSDMAIIKQIAPEAEKLTDEDFKNSKYQYYQETARKKSEDIYHALIPYFARELDSEIRKIAQIYLEQYNAPTERVILTLNTNIKEVSKALDDLNDDVETFESNKEQTFNFFKEKFNDSDTRTIINAAFVTIIKMLNGIESAQKDYLVAAPAGVFDDMHIDDNGTTLIPDDTYDTSKAESVCYNVVKRVTNPIINAHYLINILNNIIGCTVEFKEKIITFNKAYVLIADLYNSVVRYYGLAPEQTLQLYIGNISTLSQDEIKAYATKHGIVDPDDVNVDPSNNPLIRKSKPETASTEEPAIPQEHVSNPDDEHNENIAGNILNNTSTAIAHATSSEEAEKAAQKKLDYIIKQEGIELPEEDDSRTVAAAAARMNGPDKPAFVPPTNNEPSYNPEADLAIMFGREAVDNS